MRVNDDYETWNVSIVSRRQHSGVLEEASGYSEELRCPGEYDVLAPITFSNVRFLDIWNLRTSHRRE